ncbi:probable syntaxin-8B [Cyclospora cayetanensis]|uniref:Snare domain-containing protein n=2 Tax=Cyclospora cayetanensis TaxID=88456 RepID=A0A1D3CY53_9EIME|nr:probable syntaxin-8B [Cyclospora cayetanensis]OEH76124.1 snare domain-containing protein [Cyclospora cayetanensis]
MACDFWPHDTAKLRELQDSIDGLLEEAQADPTASRGKTAAVLRGHVGRMAQTFSQLEHSLMRASEAPELFGIDEEEMQRRYSQLQQLTRKREAQVEAFKVLFSLDRHVLHPKADPGEEANARFLEDFGDTTTTSVTLDDVGAADSGVSYFDAETQMLREQDEQLSFLEGSVSNLKSISYAIKDEVSVHHRLLDATEAEADKADAQLRRNKVLLKKLMKRHSTLCLLLIAVALLCLLVFLLVFTA